ncbi:LacI family DNA-binding transcriptional regulator [Virgibacillus soli]|uniref:LacI family DNA-binding transcriptional regulator n=1 Tax=Paracerasibacillus soli TaxID=480284 RepID=UPI0035EB5DF0
MSITIKDVAKEAGVSVATVSRALNNNGYVHEDTRKAVMDAIQLLNYKPNEVARSLFTKKSKFIGLVLPDITNPFFPSLARGVEDFLYAEGYHLIIGNSDKQQDKESEYIDAFLQNNVIGLIISTDEIAYNKLEKAKIPTVLLDRVAENFPAVYADQDEGGTLAAERIIASGCRCVTIVRGPISVQTTYKRYKAAYHVLKQHQIEINIIDSSLSFQGGQEAAIRLFEEYPHTDGILACNDTVAIAIMNEALRQGRKIPEDVQIIGFDDIYMSSIVYPGLSTIQQPAYEMGKKAAEILLKQINQEELSKLHFKFPVKYVERNSTKKGVD